MVREEVVGEEEAAVALSAPKAAMKRLASSEESPAFLRV